MKCSQFTTAVSLCLRRTKFTTMRNFSLARVFSFLSPPSPSPTVLLSLVWTVSLSFFLDFHPLFPSTQHGVKFPPFILSSVLNLVQRLLAYQHCPYLTLLFLSIEYRIFLNYGVLILILFLFLRGYVIFFFFLFILNDNREFFFFIFSPLLVFIFLFFYYKLYKSIIFFLHFSVFLSVKLNIIELSKL